MGNYKSVRIGDVCTITKGETGIASAIPGKYPLVTTGANRKTSNTYQFDAEAVCIPLVSSTGHGKKTLNYVHLERGKFALGTILAALIPKNPTELSAEYLHLYLRFYKNRKIVSLMKGAANVSLSIKDITKIEVNLPSISEQRSWVNFYKKFNSSFNYLQEEFSLQSTDLKFLRQSILQEAIEGKLTSDWRNKNPVKKGDPETDASALLDKIKQEKQKLIAQDKIKKDKPLPPIKPDEIPFQIPIGWLWSKLGGICEKIHYGFNASAKPEKKDVRLLRITDIQDNIVNWDTVPGCDYSATDLINYQLKKNDIVIARTGGTIGKTFLVKYIPVKSLFASYLIRVVPSSFVLVEYLKLFLESPTYWKQLYKAAWGAAQPNVNGTSLSNLHLPFPPLAEQREIVEQVDRLIGIVDELEKEATLREILSENLMQSVLKEAFEGGGN